MNTCVIKYFSSFRLSQGLFFILVYILFQPLSRLEAQSPNIAFKHYTVNDGLSHNFIRGIFQDSENFIWISTIDGLDRFDGYTFKSYKVKQDDSTSLSSNNIGNSLVEDKNGNLWVGTWGGGLCIYNRKADNFIRLNEQAETHEVFPAKFVYVLHKDSRGKIWIGTYGDGLFMADPEHLTFTHYRHDPNDPNSLSHNTVHSITEDENGKLWIGTMGGGLNYFDSETGNFVHYLHQDGDEESLGDNSVLSVFYDSKKRLWIASADNTVSLMKSTPGKFIHFRHNPNDPYSIGDYQIVSIAESNNRIWIGTNNDLLLYNETDHNFYHYNTRPFDPKSLTSSNIKCIYNDRQDRLWVGTYNGGINMFDKSFVKVLHYYTFFNENSLSFNDVSAFLQNDDGSILVGTDGGGMNTFDRKTDEFNHFKFDPNKSGTIGGNYIKKIFKDKRNRIWVGLWGAGLNIFDTKRQIFTPLKRKEWGNKWTNTANVTCITEDLDGFLWISTWSAGVYMFDPEMKSFKRFEPNENDPGSVSNKSAWAILADSENNIWVGNSNGIIDLYDRKTGKFIHFDTKEPGKSSSGILVIFEDKKGRLWIGLEGGGLKLLDKKSGTFQSYTVEDNLPSDYVSSIEEDQYGYLWLGTNGGISRFDPEKGTFKNYDISYGLQSLQFNRQASLTLESGEMLFGGVNGFNIFHPDSLMESHIKTPVVFTDFQIFNKPVPIGKKGSPLAAHINETSAITLSYSQSVFSIEYAGLNFTDPENIRYKYRLKGFVDEDWQEAGKERKVTYTNLEPGEYTFEVTVENGTEDTPIRTLSIAITPPWWKTIWARFIFILFAAGVLVSFYRLRVNGIKRQNRKLEEEVADRTSNLKKVNDALTLSQKNLKLAYDQVKLTTDALNQIAIIIKGNAEGNIIEFNNLFLEITEYDRNDIIGKTRDDLWDTLLASDVHSPEFFDDMRDTLLRGETWRGEICYKAKSGKLIWLLQNVIPLYDHGTYAGFFSFSYDITLKKKQEEQIVEAKRMAEEASAAKESFLSVMSHEIRTPLNSVIGISNLLLKRTPREDQLDLVRTLKNSGDNLMNLINNILDYNKIRAGKIELEYLPFNLKELLRQMQFAHQLTALDKKLDFKISISSNTPVLLIGDSIRLNQILNNLLHNALKFTLKGHVKLSVSLKSCDDNNCKLLFVVEDTGIGISKEKLGFIFTPFHQSENYISREFGGTGLGLSIVKDLVDLFNGSISVSSRSGAGTTFTVVLPFKLNNSITSISDRQESKVPEPDELEGYRILYVEDVESNQTLVKNFLSDNNIECITAPNGEIALMHTFTKSFDVILMDLQMPGMSGYDTTKAIQNQKDGKNVKTPIIAFTADPYSESLKSKILASGMKDLMTKPFRFDQLLEKISKVCPQRTSEDEFFSFQFYEWVFNYETKRLNEFKEMLVRDFKKFNVAMNEYSVQKDLQNMRLEIHKMAPIVKNLKYTILINLFDQYREHNEYNTQVEKLNKELNQELQNFFSTLQHLHY